MGIQLTPYLTVIFPMPFNFFVFDVYDIDPKPKNVMNSTLQKDYSNFSFQLVRPFASLLFLNKHSLFLMIFKCVKLFFVN